MNGVSETCECSHDIDTHFADRERPGEYEPGKEPKNFRGACLGMRCDCKKFVKKVFKE